MSITAKEPRASESNHWYTRDGVPRYTVIGKNGKERNNTLRDARTENLVPSVTTVLNVAAKPALTQWLQKQVLLAALTLPRRTDEPEDEWIARIMDDSKEQGRAAADAGTDIHASIQSFYEGVPTSRHEEHVKGCVEAIREHFGNQAWIAERAFAHEIGFGGKCDLHAQNIVVDVKTKDFTDPEKLDAEMRRVFDICHGCRRCFNLCDSFPRLFDLIDNGPTGELDGVKKEDYASVEEACTLCDMCFMTKCPYVPPHEWALDFPHLMLRHRAVQARKNGIGFIESQLADTDRMGRLGTFAAGLVNWATDEKNTLARRGLEKNAGIHHGARLPRQAGETFEQRAQRETVPLNEAAPAFGKRKAVLYATCFVNYNNPAIGEAALQVLARNGVECEVVYPECCGMPQLEHGDIPKVAAKAKK